MKYNGFTQIANSVMRALACITPRECRVMLCVLRHTWGYQRNETTLSGSEIAEWTGMDRAHVVTALQKLKDKGLVDVKVEKTYHICVDEKNIRMKSLEVIHKKCEDEMP